MQTSYPIFESGQVLTSRHLNDLVEYLEEQDRLTRNKLIGIGIVCGLEAGYEPGEKRIRLSGGCAITSAGYLIVQGERLLDRYRDYKLPVPQVEEAPEKVMETSGYHFFYDQYGKQIQLWELLPADYVPGPGEATPTLINAAFLQDKVLLLFLEAKLEPLKSCDINDCSDRGVELEFALRTLLVKKTDAQAMLLKEQSIAQHRVDLHNHPRFNLERLFLEKINPARAEIDTFGELYSRILDLSSDAAERLMKNLQAGYEAYKYLLGDMYPVSKFPNGPFGVSGYFDYVVEQFSQNIFLVQYLYDYLNDAAQSHNEFLAAAGQLEAECCPNPDRFPNHVLLGLVTERPTAFSAAFKNPAEVAAFDPLTANTGLKPDPKPAAFRHHFIPSRLFDRQDQRLREVRSLHYRTYLLAYRYRTEGLFQKEIRITPSQDGDYFLSDKAIPFYYAFKGDDDLHRNWSFKKTTSQRLPLVFSHQFMDPAKHPLKYKREDHNFYRVEGILGKGLGQTLQALLKQKKDLGLSFAIEPVYLGLTMGGDNSSLALNQEAMALAKQGLTRLLLCRFRDLDVVFLLLMAYLFFYLYAIITLLSRINPGTVAGLPGKPAAPAAPASPGGARTGRIVLPEGRIIRQPVGVKIEARIPETTLREIRLGKYEVGRITQNMTETETPEQALGKLYTTVRKAAGPANLFDRTLEGLRTIAPGADAEASAGKIYPYMSLLDKAEALVKVVSAPSVAEFDFQNFAVTYDSFVSAFEDFKVFAEKPEIAGKAEMAPLNKELLQNYGSVAATGPQTIVSNLAGELGKRLQTVFEELLLAGYARRHPGMEHKAGVPVGGTLILLYTHKKSIGKVLKTNRAVVETKAKASHSKFYVSTAEAMKPRDTEEVLAALPQAAKPLDEFIVIGDFCLPYLCCDTDCSDIDLS